ncbi:MAG: DUF2059 domain-containing protein [Desulfobacterales bacterium]
MYESSRCPAREDSCPAPAGQKVVVKMPVLMQRSLQFGQKRVKRMMPEIPALSEEMLQKIQPHDHARR